MMYTLLHISIMQQIKNFNEQFPRKCHQTKIVDTYPRINFFKIPAVSLFLLYWPPTSCKVSEKINEWSLRYLKMDTRTDKGDY